MRFPIGFGLLLFALVSFLPAKSGSQVPASITVDGHAQDLTHGRYFLYFFDPSCDTSYDVAKNLATLKWKNDVSRPGSRFYVLPLRQSDLLVVWCDRWDLNPHGVATASS